MLNKHTDIRVSMWSSYFIEFSPEDMVRSFANHNCRFSELSDEHGRMLLERGDPEKNGRIFKDFADSHGVSFPQGHLFLTADIAHPEKNKRRKIIDDLKGACDLYAAMDIKSAVLHPGGKGLHEHGCRYEKILEENIFSLEELLEFTVESPTTICLENVGLFSRTDKTMQIVDSIDKKNLGICLDTGHLNMVGEDCAYFARRAGNRLKALHVTDSIGEHSDHLLPHGAGTVDWEGFIKALHEIEYKGLFNFEVPKENECPIAIREAKLDYALKLGELMLQNHCATG